MPTQQIISKDFFLGDLLEFLGLDDQEDIRFRHPFLPAEISGAREVSAALEGLAAPLSALRQTAEYRQEGIASKTWEAELEGRKVLGVITVSAPGFGFGPGIESSILVGTYPSASLWRDRAMGYSPHLSTEAWDLPGGPDVPPPPPAPESEMDPKLPFPIAENMVFYSPILSKPVAGRELITKVFAHTSVIYGDRKYGPKIQSGRKAMSFWEGKVSGETIQVANEILFNGKGEAEEMVMSMRPWPVVKLFRDRCIGRTRHFLDDTYFES